MTKKIKPRFALTDLDLKSHHLWYYPEIFNGKDNQQLIAPAPKRLIADIVRSSFFIRTIEIFGCQGDVFTGMIEPGRSPMNYYPTLISDDVEISFYAGGFPPKDKYLMSVKKVLMPQDFPLRYRSLPVEGLPDIEGVIEGIYYLKKGFFGKQKLKCVKVD